MNKKRGFAGLTKLRKTLKRMDDETVSNVKKEMKGAAQRIEADAVGWAYLQDIEDTGDMIRSISYKMGRDGLTAVIGPGADKGAWRGVAFDNTSERFQKLSIKQKDAQWNFTKGYWAEFGTEGKAPQRPRSFMNKAYEDNEARLSARVKSAVANALERASR